VTVAPDRLRPLVLGQAKPRDRSEEEIQGYRKALSLIHTSWSSLTVQPALLRRLHRIAQDGSGDAGEWKAIDNEIVELRPGAPPRVRFRPTSAKETPKAIEELCRLYAHSTQQDGIPSLIAVAVLVFDFLCIHPFRDGNARVARLLTLVGLYRCGYEVGRYISLERLVEDSKEDYNGVLEQSSKGWHEGRHELVPWLNYFLGILRRAYRLFEERAGQTKVPRGAKTALVEAAVASFEGDFTLADLERESPGVSRDMVRRVLRSLQKAGRVTCLGRGPGALWRRKGTTSKKG